MALIPLIFLFTGLSKTEIRGNTKPWDLVSDTVGWVLCFATRTWLHSNKHVRYGCQIQHVAETNHCHDHQEAGKNVGLHGFLGGMHFKLL